MRSIVAFSVCLSIALFSPAAAAQPVDKEQRVALMLYSESSQNRAEAPVLASSLELEVAGLLALGSFTASFTNPSDEWMQGVYVFPLAENAAVHGLHMVVGQRVIEGAIAERDEADRSYRVAIDEGRQAVLLSEERPDVFIARVGNIGPRETAIIVIDFALELRYAAGRFTLRFPTVVGSRYSPLVRCASPVEPDPAGIGPPPLSTPLLAPPLATGGPVNPLAMHVELEAGVELAELSSPSHALAVERRSLSRYIVDLAGGAAPADRDFVLEWAPVADRAPRAALYVEERDGERYALVMLLPPLAPAGEETTRLPRETVYVIDTSGSMNGVSIEQARRALLVALDGLRPEDRFNIISFNSGMRALFAESAAAAPEELTQARAFVRGLRADGGTEMLPPLQAALGTGAPQPMAGDSVRQVFLVTDGGVDNELDILAFIRKHLGASRLYTVGIGPTPNNHFLRRAAELGHGSFTSIDRVEQVEQRMRVLLSSLEAPVVRDLGVRWSDPRAEAWPRLLPDLYQGEPLVIAARLAPISDPRAAGEIEVTGRRGGERWSASLRLDQALPARGIDRLWAHRKAELLVDSLVDGADAAGVRRAVTDLGLRHQILTPYTSLVSIDRTPGASLWTGGWTMRSPWARGR
ncbi:MAG TPA: marine proteobacterial sortase target protein [Thermoanaerobaculia bacterium]|nr:marine proteobacterial sortase target protein [Thermoanaerobaculia bacterium]